MPVEHTLSFKPCVIIPCYNHAGTMDAILSKLAAYQLPCIVVNDGSSDTTKQQLAFLAAVYPWVIMIHHSYNQGKGQAVLTGIYTAAEKGYTHALQIDADGQHDLDDIPLMLKEASKHPQALISGQPIYDESVPKSRYYSRYITHIWVWIETLSLSIKDSMCGFRVYPIGSTIDLANRVALGCRMDFDTEVMVRLYWDDIEIRFIPTNVIYPKNGSSHFDVWHDNLLISWMHARLFLQMLPKLPRLIKRNLQTQKHWSDVQERKGLWGIRLMIKTYRLFGRRVFTLLLYPVTTYFWLTGKSQRRASTIYLQRLREFAELNQRALPKGLNSFRHFRRFGEAMLDKLAGWLGDIQIEDIHFPNKAACANQIASDTGTLILASHLGDIELCRALGCLSHKKIINALVFTRHSTRFNQIMSEISPDSTVNMIPVDEIGPDTAMLLKQKLDAGEWVAIVGDRTSANPYHRDQNRHIIWADFLGKPAPFPSGPFILAAALRCPVYLMFGLKPKDRFQVYFEKFADPLLLPRATRQESLKQAVQHYARRLESHCVESPLDWFNFYDFWRLSRVDDKEKRSSPHES